MRSRPFDGDAPQQGVANQHRTTVMTRRRLLQTGTLAAIAAEAGLRGNQAVAQERGNRPERTKDVEVLNPCGRVPVSLIIDDSTCLVNLAHFGIPQFAEVFPDNYKQDWRKLPREIPDSFVRKFGEWCHEHGVKGKYSIVPYPGLRRMARSRPARLVEEGAGREHQAGPRC